MRMSMICKPKTELVWGVPTLKLLPVLAELLLDFSVTRPAAS